jgi:putative transposase
MDKELAVRIEEWYEHDDTMGHRQLAVLLRTGKNRVKRGMRKYGLCARRKRKTYVYPGKAAVTAPHLLRNGEMSGEAEIVFSDIFEVRLADASKGRGCFALRKRTRQILGMACDYHMRADLVISTIDALTFAAAPCIWQSEKAHPIWSGTNAPTAVATRLSAVDESCWDAHRQRLC